MQMLELLTEVVPLREIPRDERNTTGFQRGSLQDVGGKTKSSLRLDC